MMSHRYVKGWIGGCVLLIVSGSQAAPIVESRTGHSAHGPQHRGSSYSSSGSASSVDNRSRHQTLSLLQVEILEQEVRQLRGQLEEQAYELKRLTKNQQELYLDLERKLQEKGTHTGSTRAKATTTVPAAKPIAVAPPPKAPPSAPTVATPQALAVERPIYEVSEPLATAEIDQSADTEAHEEEMEQIPLSGLQPTQSPPEETLGSGAKRPTMVVKGVLAEKNMYENAYNLVLNKRYAEAVPALQAFLTQYPQGQYAPNGHYWLGEVYSLQGRANKNAELLNKASVEFMAITTQFPNHQKAMEALLKLGILENDKGNTEAARQYLTHVKERYPGTSVARIASTQLQRLK